MDITEETIQGVIKELTRHNLERGCLLSKTCEELGELKDVLQGNLTAGFMGNRGKMARLIEETADCFVMLKQLIVAFGIGDEVAAMIWYKVARTRRENAAEGK